MAEMHGSYNWALVALSCFIAVIASLTALELAGRVRANRGAAGWCWLLGGAFSMGTGIWSMHFIGMLSFSMPVKINYSLSLTFLSLLSAMFSSALALAVVQGDRLQNIRIILGGIIMGLGIGLMHYMGMEAMNISGSISYDPLIFSLSILIAISASLAALRLFARLNPAREEARKPLWQRGLASLIMGVAIAGMHYTGMAAARFSDFSLQETTEVISSARLAGVIALFAICIMLVALIMSIYDTHLFSRTNRLANSLKEANEQLKSMVYQDQLTKLPNRLLLNERLAHIFETAGTVSATFAILFIDLDRFKNINDTLGHHIGDELVKQASVRLRSALRESDIVARMGGDEFIIVTSAKTGEEESERIAQRLVKVMNVPFQIANNVVHVTASIGVGLYPQHGRDEHELMSHADAAMYCVKECGGNGYRFFERGMNSLSERKSRVEYRLRSALVNDLLSLAYQPKVDTVTGEVIGLEALLRWHDDELGNVTPDEIIPIAESTGLILPIGEWVLRTACHQAQRWHEQGYPLLPMAVNLSAIQLNDSDFVTMVENILAETGFPPGKLELEITESAIMQNPEQAQTILNELCEMGITLSIDDFGTGYSNLAQLRNFPVKCLKIDRSFTSGVETSLQDAAIVKAMITLAHSLNLEVVVEGVETASQLAFIRNLKGQQYQGYFCSRPLQSSELRAFLESWPDHIALTSNGAANGNNDLPRESA